MCNWCIQCFNDIGVGSMQYWSWNINSGCVTCCIITRPVEINAGTWRYYPTNLSPCLQIILLSLSKVPKHRTLVSGVMLSASACGNIGLLTLCMLGKIMAINNSNISADDNTIIFFSLLLSENYENMSWNFIRIASLWRFQSIVCLVGFFLCM